MWWTTAHKSIVDRLKPDQRRCIKEDGSILVCVRNLQHWLRIDDTKTALHLVRGIKTDAKVSEMQLVFEELAAREDRRAFHITST